MVGSPAIELRLGAALSLLFALRAWQEPKQTVSEARKSRMVAATASQNAFERWAGSSGRMLLMRRRAVT